MSNITVIVPIHKLEKDYLVGCIESIKNQKVKPYEVLFVTSNDEEVKNYLNEYDFGDIKDVTKIIENETGNYDFQSQINYGVEQSTGDYFTFVEYDDEVSPIWIKNGVEYTNAYPEVGIFLPIVYETDENGKFISFTNESVWAKDFSEEIGRLDNNTLLRVQNFNFDGMITKRDLFLENGGLKSNMKLTFTYEFLLRMSYLSTPIMVIPKLGYRHTNNREGSLFVEYKNTIDVMESKFWVNKAKKEYFFTEDREITYEV
jgi:cellulose synthase/poly-beta-1,6-N-acetylglucosamine synthase-like glycosyltransferase